MAELALGIKAMDADHVLLLGQIDALVEQARSPGPSDRLVPAVETLLGSLRQHFASESALMHQHAFEGREAHESAHHAFLAALEGLRANLSSSYRVPIDKKVELLIGDWLQLHIEGYDAILARFLKAAGVH
ncbi:MAG TPA: hemerythrin family protein [Myxococcales bacterium]|jgi:hemerythrin-like metal-binding protein